nr:MAG TPA: hypothetical protein [Caudoviricetes sp.]
MPHGALLPLRPVYRFKPPGETTNAQRRTKKKKRPHSTGLYGRSNFCTQRV